MPDPISEHPDLKYGAAARYAFDDPNKWVTVPGVPLLDEHQMTNADGKTVATVDRKVLEEIAANNNRRVRETGDPATLILGHTSDDPRAPEKPAQGFVVNYRVAPFKRDPKSGAVTYAIHGDYKLRPKNADLVEKYPRRSVELWWHKKELDPIAMLGGSAPERDLSVVIKNARLNHVTMDSVPAVTVSRNGSRPTAVAQGGTPIKFHRRGASVIENYAIRDTLSLKNRLKRYSMSVGKDSTMDGCGRPPRGATMNYDDGAFGEDEGMDTRDLHDGGDTDLPDASGADDLDGMDDDSDMGGAGESDPVLAKVFQSKQFRGMSSKIDQMMQMMEALTASLGGGTAGGGMAPPMTDEDQGGDEMPPPGAGAQQLPPEEADGGETFDDGPPGSPQPGNGDEVDESRQSFPGGKKPVRMDQTAFPGSADVNIPQFVGQGGKPKPRMMSRNSTRGAPVATPNTAARRTSTPAGRATSTDPEVIRLRRQTHDLTIKYAQSEAEKRVGQLISEGILFGRNEQEHEAGVTETKAYFTGLLASGGDEGVKDVEHEESIIRSRYSRRQKNPAAPAVPGVARYARDPNPREAGPVEGAGDPNDFVPEDPEQASEFADLQAVRRMSRAEAVKFMRQRYAK